MNKKLLLILLIFLFIGCSNNEKIDKPLAGSVQADGTIKDLTEKDIIK